MCHKNPMKEVIKDRNMAASQICESPWHVRVSLSLVQLCGTQWTVAHQAPLSMGFQARTLGQVAISYSRGFSQPRDRTHVSCISCIGRWILSTEPPGKSHLCTGAILTFFVIFQCCYTCYWSENNHRSKTENRRMNRWVLINFAYLRI